MKTILNWQLPIKTASEANSSEHWAKKAKRHRLQKGWIIVKFYEERPVISLPAHVVLTRISPRILDSDDNLPMSLKFIKDEVAAQITGDHRPGRADGDKRISWEYRQEKGNPHEYAVKIEIMDVNDD